MHTARLHLPILHTLEGTGPEGRKVLIPPKEPVIFLAGPIRNAPPWHSEAVRFLLRFRERVFIACPARTLDRDLMPFVEKDDVKYLTFPRQRAWERYYLQEAAQYGCIVFWLCNEMLPRVHPEKVYAHITMLELGEWVREKKLKPETRLVIGTDGEFPEWSPVHYDLCTEIPQLPIYTSLESTMQAALSIALERKRGR